jgi:hypothetical protein
MELEKKLNNEIDPGLGEYIHVHIGGVQPLQEVCVLPAHDC